MAWLFSGALLVDTGNSHCLAERGGASSEPSCLGGEPSVPSKPICTRPVYLYLGRKRVIWNPSRSGMTSVRLTAIRGEGVLTSFLAGFPVRTSQRPGKAKGSAAKRPDFGSRCSASLEKFSRKRSSSKTRRCSQAGGSTKSSVTLPRWGTMRNGELSERQTPSGLVAVRALITSAIGSGFSQSVPTPTVPNGGRTIPDDAIWTSNRTAYRKDGKKLQVGLDSYCRRAPTPNTRGYRSDGELLLLARMGLTPEEFEGMSHKASQSKRQRALRVPTPRSMDGSHGAVSLTDTVRRRVDEGTANLAEYILTIRVPTPCASELRQGKSSKSQLSLSAAVGIIQWAQAEIAHHQRVQTPTTRNCRPSSRFRRETSVPLKEFAGRVSTPTCQDAKCNGTQSQQERKSKALNAMVGGALNPLWVEWLMGWPIGWTGLDALATDKFQWWLQSHTRCFQICCLRLARHSDEAR